MITAYNRCKVVGRIYTSSMLMFQKVAARLYTLLALEYTATPRDEFTLHHRAVKRTFPRFRFHVFFTYDNAQASSEASTIKLSCMLSCCLLLVERSVHPAPRASVAHVQRASLLHFLHAMKSR